MVMAMDYEKKYKEAVNKIKNLLDDGEKNGFTIVTYKTDLESIFPELKESEDERIRKELIEHCKNQAEPYIKTGNKCPQIQSWIAWLEKQGEQKASYTTIAETGNGGINALVTGELSNSCDYEEKPVGKVEPKFKVKYAGSEYNVLEIKEIAGDTYYGIEDEPNHIDYVLPDNCEIVSEQKSDWSEEDDDDAWMNDIISKVENNLQLNKAEIDWLKSLKERYTWKPSDEQVKAFEHFVRSIGESGFASPYDGNTKLVYSLLSELKKLRKE